MLAFQCPVFLLPTDDISEMYYHLRKLVLEYLGIAPATAQDPPELETSATDLSIEGEANSAAGPDVLDLRSQQQQRSMSAPITADGVKHTWSRPSLVDSSTVEGLSKEKERAVSLGATPVPRGIVVRQPSFNSEYVSALCSVILLPNEITFLQLRVT